MIDVAMDLHEAIMNQLQKRMVTYKHQTRRGEEYSGWNDEMERRLWIYYTENPELVSVQAKMTFEYPQYRACFEIMKLRAKIDKMVRIAVRKLVS